MLARWLRTHARDSGLHEYRIKDRWAELVGEQIAERTEPASLRETVLTVVVASAAWLNELSFMRASIVRQINELLGARAVAAIRLVAGRVRPSRKPRVVDEQPAYVELPPEQVEEIEREVAEVADPDLREAIKRARLAQLGRTLRFGGDRT